jgi:hypothetical protein
MVEWLHNLPVVWMVLVVFTTTYLVTGGIYAVVMAFAVGERARAFKTVSAGMLPTGHRLWPVRRVHRFPGLERCRSRQHGGQP